MRARIFIFTLAAVICAGLLWFSFQKRGATAQVELRLAELRDRTARLGADLSRAEKTVVPRVVPAEKNPVAASATPSVKTDAPARAPRPPSLTDLAHDNPDLMNLWIANQRSQLQQRYGVLFQELNLTMAQQDKFKDVLAGESARGIDIGAAVKEQGLTFDDPVVKKLRDDSRAQMKAELAALLGEQDFLAYQDFERTVRVRGFVDGFAVQTAASDPLTPQQAEQLARALAAASPSYQTGGEADPASIDWAAVDRAAQEFMSSAQLAAWKLGVAHNPYGGSRIDGELKKVYDAAKAKPAAQKPGG